MSISRNLFQELWDEIIDNLGEYTSDLTSCALVCRACGRSAQRVLFRSIVVGGDDGNSVNPRSEQLGRILTEFPYLIDLVSELHIRECDDENLRPLVQIPWTHLSTLTLGDGRLDPLSPSSIEILFPLLSLPSLRDVCCFSSWISPADLRELLLKINPDIPRVRLTNGTGVFDDTPIYIPPSPPPRSSLIEGTVGTHGNIPRPKLTHLDFGFFGGNGWVEMLRHPMFLRPFIWGVVHVRWRFCQPAWFHTLLGLVSDTLQSLDLDARDPSLDLLDFSVLPTLSHLIMSRVGDFLRAAMTRSNSNSIHTITYHLGEGGWAELKEIEEVILSATMPSLKKVEVRVMESYFAEEIRCAGGYVRFVEKHMPRIFEKNLLAVVFE
ncbi:hypothetical protein R3P38DRAFT_3108584 [Favolaschia claudopus]|uniref:F-box domain-containing protein n=1 Tax=Favolaschia claudopus TaxID=2862362 RepID=A0AAV9ZHQ8_9AGAR